VAVGTAAASSTESGRRSTSTKRGRAARTSATAMAWRCGVPARPSLSECAKTKRVALRRCA
jgi:hypothetical protein